jgi:cysteine desulfurase
MIYLDYNASVPLRPKAKDALVAALELEGNPSSPHFLGRTLRSFVDNARKDILKAVGGQRLVFTSGGTEANAMALFGVGPIPILVSSIEHNSVLKAVSQPHLIPVTREGMVDLEELKNILASFETPGLLSLILVNNETGVIQPVREAAALAQGKGWKVHTDASQALGHIPCSFEDLNVDMMTLSSHKCGGPVGVGALILKEDFQLSPLIRGAGQEYGMRAGTLSAPLILGFSAALKEALQEEEESSHLLRGFQERIEKALPEAIIYGKDSPRASHVVCISMPGVLSHLQLMAFDLQGIALSAGTACSSGTIKGSHVLAAMGVQTSEAQCAIRVSMGWNTQEHEISAFIEEWKKIHNKQTKKEVR